MNTMKESRPRAAMPSTNRAPQAWPSRTSAMSAILAAILALALAMTLAGCFGGLMTPRDPTAASDNAVAEQVLSAKEQADANPGDSQKAVAYAELLAAAHEGGTVERGRVDGATLVPDALGKLDAAVTANPDDAAMLTATKGKLLTKSGAPDLGLAEYEASMAMAPNLYALLPLIDIYAAERRQSDIDQHCKNTRKTVSDNDRLYTLLAACASARPGMAPAAALPWASRKDVAFYQEQQELARARAEARQREEAQRQAELQRQRDAQEAQRQQAAANQAAANQASNQAAGGGVYSANVSVHSACSENVRLFRGRVNGRYTGGGTYGWHSSNSTASYHLSGDDELCIVQNDRDIVSCTKPQDGARLEVTSSCSGFTRR